MSAHRNGDIEAHLPAPTATQEKDLLSQQPSEKATTRAPRGTTLSETMPAPIRLLLTLLVCFLVSFSVAAAWLPDAPSPEQHAEAAEVSDSTISHILKAVSPGSLHDALHRFLPRYQHGVYESDTAALEAVHREHAALAAAVVQHLARRDNTTSSSTSQSPPPTSSSTSIPTSSTVPPPTSSSTSIPTSTSSRTSSATSSDTTPPTTSSDTSSSRSRRPVTSTFTSNVNGVPVVVTSTQYVDGDMHESATQTKPAGSLHTDAAAGVRRDLGFVFAGAVGAVGMLLV